MVTAVSWVGSALLAASPAPAGQVVASPAGCCVVTEVALAGWIVEAAPAGRRAVAARAGGGWRSCWGMSKKRVS